MGITQNTPLKNYSVAYFWGKNTGFICKTSSDQGSAVANETHANICPNPFLCVTSSSTPICDRALKWKITAQCTEIIQTITKLLLHAYAHMQHPAFSSGRAWLAHQSQKPWDKESKLGGEKKISYVQAITIKTHNTFQRLSCGSEQAQALGSASMSNGRISATVLHP